MLSISTCTATIRAMDNVAYFCTLPGPMQYAVAEMLEDEAWVDSYLALNSKNLAESHAVLTAALAEAGVPVVAATAGMFVWIDLGAWLKESTWWGLYKLNAVLTHSLKAPGSNH